LAAASGAETGLEQLDLSLMRQGWENAQMNQSVTGQPMQMGGNLYFRGERFRAMVGVNDLGRREPRSVEFVVLGDDKPLFRSGVLRGGDAPKPVDVSLVGVDLLMLKVTDGGDNTFSDQGNPPHVRRARVGESRRPGRDRERHLDALRHRAPLPCLGGFLPQLPAHHAPARAD